MMMVLVLMIKDHDDVRKDHLQKIVEYWCFMDCVERVYVSVR